MALASISVAWGAADAGDLVRKSLANYQRDYDALLNYTYTQRDVESKSGGKEISTSEVINLEGTPYERLILKNGQPLTPADQKREEEKYRKAAAARAAETPAQRHKRIGDYEKQRSFLREVPEAFQFKLTGEESVNGRPAYVVECTPNPEYKPRNMGAHIFSKIEAKLWIDKQDLQWARAEAHVMDTFSLGLLVARVSKGSRITIEQTRLNDRFWAPKRFDISGSARIMMVKNRNLTEEITYSDYRLTKPGDLGRTAKLLSSRESAQ